MKILFLTRLFYPHIGGVEKHVLEISKRLVKKGHEVAVIAEELILESPSPRLNVLKHLNGEEEVEKIKIIRIRVGKEDWFKKFRVWKELWKHKDLIKNTDIIHCHDVFFWYFPFRFLFPWKKVFTTFHGYEDYPIPKKAIVVRKISEKLSFGNICIGDFIKKWYKTKPNFISYGGVYIPKKTSDKNYDNESAVFIGRLDEQTGILTYLKAFEIIRKKTPDFNFLVIGDGKFKKRIKNDVKTLGFQKNPERYFSNYHFAFVSRYLSILEAMAAKKLVFAVYDNPVKKDYLEMAPFSKFIIITNSFEELALKISFFLKNPKEEKQMVDNAYDWVKNQTWEDVLKIYFRLWGFKN